MWIAKPENWNTNSTQLERFAIERIIQRCDFSENISNKHRTSNGYTQLKELIQYCELSLKRSRTIKTLIVVLEEATSPYVKQNISSDCIVKKYFVDLGQFVSKFNSKDLLAAQNQPNQLCLQQLTQKLKLFEKQLDQFYFVNLCDELLSITYEEQTALSREAYRISNLIDLLVPYLVFQGYSIASISEVLRQWLKCGYHITIKKILGFFNFKTHCYTFLQYLGGPSTEAEDFLDLLKTELPTNVEEVRELGRVFNQKYPTGKDGLYAKYTIDTLDPHKHVRSNFDSFLKKLVVQRERQSLAVFNEFFNNSFWHKKPN